MLLTVGIATAGTPIIRPSERRDLTRVENVLIGIGFHWQRTISCDFPGEIRLNPDASSPFTLLNTLPVETYLECVVGSEMSPDAPAEFLRAHAIISRSWVAGKILGLHAAGETNRAPSNPDDISLSCCEGNHRNRIISNLKLSIIDFEDTASHIGFHVCADDHCQRYQGVQPLSDKALDAIRSTAGLVLSTPSGGIVDARFSKCCGGRTELFSTCWQDKEEECLESFSDPWCDLSDLPAEKKERLLKSVLKDYDRATDGGYRWETTISSDEIARHLKEKFQIDIGRILHLRPLRRGPSGRISLLEIIGSDATLQLGKELYIRRALAPTHLYSSAFEIEVIRQQSPIFNSQFSNLNSPSQNAWRLSGRGWGHGVGLCQIGAARMALAGHTHREILSFYYPHSQILTLNP